LSDIQTGLQGPKKFKRPSLAKAVSKRPNPEK